MNLLLDDSPVEFKWYNEPHSWKRNDGVLTITTNSKTDFWQKTKYDIESDNGHFYYLEVSGDFRVTCHCEYSMENNYDHGGLMIYVNKDKWFKTTAELEPEGNYSVGAVVTTNGYSDWSSENYTDSLLDIDFMLEKIENDITAFYKTNKCQKWNRIRMAHLDIGETLKVGIIGCSPSSENVLIKYTNFSLQKINKYYCCGLTFCSNCFSIFMRVNKVVFTRFLLDLYSFLLFL